MQPEDLILVSVDDHVVEPPGMFDRHIPARYRDRAPRVLHKKDGSDVWVFEGRQMPNIGLNAVAGRPPEEYGVEPTAYDQLRPGCYDLKARIDDMNANGVLGSMCFPSFPAFCGQVFQAAKDKELALAVLRAYRCGGLFPLTSFLLDRNRVIGRCQENAARNPYARTGLRSTTASSSTGSPS